MQSVAPAKDVRRAFPPLRSPAGTLVVLIPIGGNDEWIPWRDPMRDDDQTHPAVEFTTAYVCLPR